MSKKPRFEPELYSVNTFRDLAANSGIVDKNIEAIAVVLSSVYDAETLADRLKRLEVLIELLSPHERNNTASSLLYQCYDFVRLIVGTETPEDVPLCLAQRALRTPFQPNFARDAPKDAPLRWLLDNLADWHQESDDDLAHEKFQAILLASNKHRTTYAIEHDEDQSDLHTISVERKMFIDLSLAHNLKHLIEYGTTKLANKEYQQLELERGIREASATELEEKRFLPMVGRFYKIQLRGSGDDRHFKVRPFSTKDCVAHGVHYGEASFIVTISGDFFAEESGVIGSRFDRNPFFAGRIAVDDEGYLKYYDNFSECFAHDERNLLFLTRYFKELGLIGDRNPNVIAGLAKQREIVGGKEAFLRYAHKFDAFALWQANEHLLAVRKERPVTLDNAAIQDLTEPLEELHEKAKKEGLVPAWLENWKNNLGYPGHTFPPVVDHLNTDPANIHGFFDATKKIPAKPSYELTPCKKNAEDDPAAGIFNNFVEGDGQKKLQELRRKIKLKDRLDYKKLSCVFVDRRPYDGDIKQGLIYFYPYHQSETHRSYCILLDEKNHLIYESQIATAPNEKEKNLKKLALKMRRYERILMTSPHELPYDSPEKMQAIKECVQANVSLDVAMVFFDEIRVIDRRAMQVNNLFGPMCLFHTNSTGYPPFDSKKKDYVRDLELPHIDHYDQRSWASPAVSKLTTETDRESPGIEEVDDFKSGGLTLQPSHFGSFPHE